MFCLRLHQIKIMNLNHIRRFCIHPMMNENGIINLRVKQEHINIDSSFMHTGLHLRNKEKAVSKIVKREQFKEKAREATVTTYYSLVVVAGLGLTLILGYTIYKEFFSSFSCQSVYSEAAALVTKHPDVQNLLGLDLKCYGEETRRGRRTHVRHSPYEEAGHKGMRMQFHVKGDRGSGTVSLDARQGSDYVYLYVQQDHFPHRTVVIRDNRRQMMMDQEAIDGGFS